MLLNRSPELHTQFTAAYYRSDVIASYDAVRVPCVGIFYVRDSNFYMNGLGMNDTAAMAKVGLRPNETQGCDVTAGVYWAVSSIRRSISYGSEAFFCTAAVCSPNMDVPHYGGYNPSTPWCTDGQGFMKLEGNVIEDWNGYAAVRSNGQARRACTSLPLISPYKTEKFLWRSCM